MEIALTVLATESAVEGPSQGRCMRTLHEDIACTCSARLLSATNRSLAICTGHSHNRGFSWPCLGPPGAPSTASAVASPHSLPCLAVPAPQSHRSQSSRPVFQMVPAAPLLPPHSYSGGPHGTLSPAERCPSLRGRSRGAGCSTVACTKATLNWAPTAPLH